jgi:hypothetical protein
MAKWFVKLSPNRKALFIMSVIALVVFIGLCPLFFIHNYENYPYVAYPLGWLLGSAAELIAFVTLVRFSDSLFKDKDATHATSSMLAMGSAGLRIFLYAVVLVVSGICTFKSEWFGGFNAFNFYTTAAGLLPMLGVVFFTQFFELKHQSSAPQGSQTEPNEGEKK